MATANPFTAAKAPNAMQNLPPDLMADQTQLLRQQQLADLLRKQALEPAGGTDMVNGWAVKKSPLEGLSKMAQALLGSSTQNDVDAKQLELAKALQDRNSAESSSFLSALQGTPGTPGVDAQPEIPADKNKALAIALNSSNPMLQGYGKSMIESMAKAPENPFGKVDAKDFTAESLKAFSASGGKDYTVLVPVRKLENINGVAVNMFGSKGGDILPQDPNALFALGSDGKPIRQEQVYQTKKDLARSGAANVSIKNDVKMGESLGAQVGPMMKDSTSIAEGAVKQVDAAQRIVKAIDGDKAFSGPLSGSRLKVAQVGQMLGVGGKDEAEKIANTRATMRGLAELTLQGRQQMKGQGAITESEGKLAERAMSGDIEDLTAAEIKQLAKASERSARFNYNEHQRKLKVMQGNPSLQGIAPFYEGPSMPPEAAPPAQSAPGGFKILGVK